MYLRLVMMGLKADARACTLCESAYVRASRHRTPWWLRFAGLTLFRCESCRRLVFLPRRFLSSDAFGRA